MTSAVVARSVGLAVSLSLLLAAEVAAATWSPPVRLGSGSVTPQDLLALGDADALVAYRERGDIYVERTIDAGSSWGSRFRVAADWVPGFTMDGRGSNVHATFVKNGHVRYRRSQDGGVSFEAPFRIGSPPRYWWVPGTDLAADDDGRVAAVWTEAVGEIIVNGGRIRARVSTDGGDTFGPTKTVARFAKHPGSARIAIADGIIHLVYLRGGRLRFRRSFDDGASWTRPATLARASDGPSLTARRRRIFVSYSNWDGSRWRHRYVRSRDGGATWSSPIAFPSDHGGTGLPTIEFGEAGLWIAYTGCSHGDCDTGGVYYRESANGREWTPRERVSTRLGVDEGVSGSAFAGRPIVLVGATLRSGDFAAYARTRTP